MTTRDGFTLWFTGLPCSGKTTVSRLVARQLRDMSFSVEVLDGDEVRPILSPGLDFTPKDRATHLERVAYVAKLLSRNGVAVVAAFVSPYRILRYLTRARTTNYIEVYVKCPFDICVARDTKGMYAKAIAGNISHFTGVSDPYEEPHSSEIIVETDKETPAESAEKVIRYIVDHYRYREDS